MSDKKTRKYPILPLRPSQNNGIRKNAVEKIAEIPCSSSCLSPRRSKSNKNAIETLLSVDTTSIELNASCEIELNTSTESVSADQTKNDIENDDELASEKLLFRKYFRIIQRDPNNPKFSTYCLTCEKETGLQKIVSGSFKATSNFIRHLRVINSTYSLNEMRIVINR